MVNLERQRLWTKPPPGSLKCDIEVAWAGQNVNSGAAWILHDDQGKTITILHSRRAFSLLNSDREEKLCALHWAIKDMVYTRQHRIIFESSCFLAREASFTHRVCWRPIYHRWHQQAFTFVSRLEHSSCHARKECHRSRSGIKCHSRTSLSVLHCKGKSYMVDESSCWRSPTLNQMGHLISLCLLLFCTIVYCNLLLSSLFSFSSLLLRVGFHSLLHLVSKYSFKPLLVLLEVNLQKR